MRLGLLQHACTDDLDANVDQAIDMIHDAAEQGAELIVTQELFRGLYFPVIEDEAVFDQAESIPGPTTDRLCETAKELGVTISASLFEKQAPGLYYNTSVMINPKGAITGKYRKMHIPDDPGFYEKYYFTPGDLGFQSHEVMAKAASIPEAAPLPGAVPLPGVASLPGAGAGVGMLVCWDQWFPEAARLTAMQGAELLLYPTAIGYLDGEPAEDHEAQRDAWITIQRSHAIANGVFVAACNRIGREGDKVFWGSSFIADPLGRVLAQAPEDEEAVLVADIDFSQVEKTRRNWAMFFRDRRVDAYEGITKRWND